ncbi:MAG: DUF4837 family protein, partial [Bacteroidota bacterium]
MKKSAILFLAVFAFFANACKESGTKDYKPSSIGAINSLAVVMDNELWKGKVGDEVRRHFAAPVVGLIWDEPLFSIQHLPPQVFTGTTRYRRSTLFIQRDSLDIAHVKTNLYAKPQKVAVIKGRTDDEIIENLNQKSQEIIAQFKDLEVRESQKRFLRSLNKEKALEEEFGVTLTIPSLYKVGKHEDNFVWIDMQIPKGTKNIIAYEVPYESLSEDSTLVQDIVKMRDSIGSLYIPGPDVPGKTTHMRTEPAFSPSVFQNTIAGLNTIEVRGIWDIKNYPMAGPFVTYVITDVENHRKLVLEGFTFAPATEKRDYMFELEAILKTVKFHSPLAQK